MFQLTPPARESFKADWLARCRQRLVCACDREKLQLPEQEIEQFVDAAWHLENGAPPNYYFLIAKRGLQTLNSQTIDDAVSIAAAAKKLMKVIENSNSFVRIDVVEALEARGIALDQFEKGLSSLAEIATGMSKQRRNVQKPGNTTKLRNDWVSHLWPTLKANGVSIKAAGRILAALLGPDTEDAAKSIFQAIRNANVR